MKDLRLKHPKSIIIAYLSINSIRNKFETFSHMTKNHVGVLVFAETKLDSTFPQKQFLLNGFKRPYPLYVTSNSGGILVYVNDQVPSKEIKSVPIPNDIQAIPIELNLRKCKCLLLPHLQTALTKRRIFIDQIEKISDSLSNSIEKSLMFGDFHMELTNILNSFIENNGLYSLITPPTCFKSSTVA